MHARLRQVVKAYDVRGRVPDQLDTDIARALGAAFADETGIADTGSGGGRAVLGHDMRSSSPDLVEAIADGVRSRGADVVDIGLASTDMLYCASGTLDLPGVMVTASHNPAQDNGLKLCRAGARPIGLSSGLAAMAEAAGPTLDSGAAPAPRAGTSVERVEFLQTYADTLLGLAPVDGGAARALQRAEPVSRAGRHAGGRRRPAQGSARRRPGGPRG